MSKESIRALFAKRQQRPYEPMLAGVTGSYRFDVEGVGSFFVSVDDGQLAIAEIMRDADCVIACDEDLFVRIAEGKQNLLTAAMQGLVAIYGDLALAQKLDGILPAPPREAEAQPGGQP
jgi:putative sterol carrier protein